MIDITFIFRAIILIIAGVVAKFVIPYFKAKTTSEDQAKIYTLVQIAVQAAEQIITATGAGAEKKKYVQEWLAARNLTIDDTALDAMIESAVYEMKHSFI